MSSDARNILIQQARHLWRNRHHATSQHIRKRDACYFFHQERNNRPRFGRIFVQSNFGDESFEQLFQIYRLRHYIHSLTWLRFCKPAVISAKEKNCSENSLIFDDLIMSQTHIEPQIDSTSHELYMRRALELARNGAGHVSPNPLVGSVIVYRDRVIAEGWHQQYGGPHAEVNALAAVKEGDVLKDSTLYVTLEPCSHTGKTPPCADAIIRHGVRKVVIANRDPNPLVAGRGIEKLRAAGVNVVTDILADE